jgi:hypothetical protein
MSINAAIVVSFSTRFSASAQMDQNSPARSAVQRSLRKYFLPLLLQLKAIQAATLVDLRAAVPADFHEHHDCGPAARFEEIIGGSNVNKKIKIALGIILGSAAGFAYYYFIGCRTGSCPITGNPYISSAYGALLGLLLAFPSGGKKSASAKPE